MFYDTVNYLQDSSDKHINIIAQNPVYTPLDVEFLSSLEVRGMIVPVAMRMEGEASWQSQTAFDLFSSSTFVCELCIEHDPSFLERLIAENVKLAIGSMLGATDIVAEERDMIAR